MLPDDLNQDNTVHTLNNKANILIVMH